MKHPFSRRLITIGVVVILWAVAVGAFPILLVLAAIVDSIRWIVARTPFMATRLMIFGAAYLTVEVAGIVAMGAAWVSAIGSERRLLDRTFAIQRWWAETVFRVVRRVFGLTFDADGLDSVVDPDMIIVARHASIVDNLLAAHYITRPHGTHISYVMKSELQVDPCLDIAGNRLPNLFVRRGVSGAEVASIRTLGARERTVIIYPEGTRFDPAKLQRALRRLRSSPDFSAIAETFTHVLPPRLSGTLALLETNSGDVVVMAHRGLDGFARIADIWRGAMVGTHVQAEFWRIPREEIPEGRAERAMWLFETWRRLDDWVGGARRG
ncbi:MAG: 1-acyl-sn-glycerol-3-phosphate acyltransferase [Acidimicrobiia bacterium]|nr:1-acyl-sn-glycerol-3-phosphate acyltransferase [Acidimicrobiia bacterium]MDH4306166.1 1-acyl-sn-glycerol-3-phosphate acyltransferase [Acidimicrobiia bacterium]MDH5292088.1 1-acyl-sn-glycerol-3-phosphate acyltransferase [Acidimicrobiia bacterium]